MTMFDILLLLILAMIIGWIPLMFGRLGNLIYTSYMLQGPILEAATDATPWAALTGWYDCMF